MAKAPPELSLTRRCYLLDLLGDNEMFATTSAIPPALEAVRDRIETGQRLDLAGPLQIEFGRRAKRPFGDLVAVVDDHSGELFPSLIVSHRLAAVFEQHCPGGLETVAVELLAAGKTLRDDFVLVNPLHTVDVLDEHANKANYGFHANAVIDPFKVERAPQLFRFMQGRESHRYGIRSALAEAISEGFDNIGWYKLAGPTSDGQLLGAARAGDLATVRRLLASGANANGPKGADKPLFKAVEGEHLEVCRALIDAGASVNAKDEDKATALTYAVGSIELVRYLLEAGADPDLGDPLSVCEDPTVVTALLDAGASLTKGTFVATSIKRLMDPDESDGYAAIVACLRAALPKAGKLKSRIEEALGAFGGDSTAANAIKGRKRPMLEAAAAAGTRAGSATALDFDPDKTVVSQIEDWSDDAWYSDGVRALEEDYRDEGDAIYQDAAIHAYSHAFITAMMARPAVQRLLAKKPRQPKKPKKPAKPTPKRPTPKRPTPKRPTPKRPTPTKPTPKKSMPKKSMPKKP